MSDTTPLLVFADDWGRHPSSCQHLIGRMLPRRSVTWVNTIMRPPRLDWSTLRRGFQKVRQWFGPGSADRSLPINLRVLNPRMWPWSRSKFDRWMNRKLLKKQLTAALEDLPQPPIVLTTVPIVADLVDELPVRKWIYYCVDDFSRWPGLDRTALTRMERDLVGRVDRVIAVSENLQACLARLGRSSTLLTHGIDPDFWRHATGGRLFDDLPRPLVLFFGLIDRRLDLSFVRRLGEKMSAGTILFVGPNGDPDPALFSLPRVKVAPPLAYEELPFLARAADVLIMPYADLPVTRAMQPLKLKEYLATGKPAVVRDLPANREWSDCLDLAADAESFARLVLERVEKGAPREQQQARSRLRAESWAEKVRQLEFWLDEEESHAVAG